MRIDKMHVRNFRCFHTQSFAFHPELNIFIGDNGSGKTSALEAVRIAAGAWLDAIPGLESPQIMPSDVRVLGRTFGSQISFNEENPTIIDATGEFYGNSIEWRRIRMTSRLDEETYPIPQSMESNDSKLRDLGWDAIRIPVTDGQPTNLPLLAYYGAGRFPREAQSAARVLTPLAQKELSRRSGYDNCLAGTIDPSLFTRWMEYEARLAYQEESESAVYRAVKAAASNMLEGANEIRFDNKSLEVVVVFEGNDVRPFDLLSDGQRLTLALAGDMAARISRLNPHLDGDMVFQTPGVVLIDELDLHLHPRWQRHVVADLRRTFPKVQFIVTTHSPQIIGEVEPECVIALENYRVAEHPAQSEGMDTNFILRNVMHASDRQQGTTNALRAIEALIGEDEYESAQEKIDSLRANLGPFPELTGLQTRIDRIRLLGDKR